MNGYLSWGRKRKESEICRRRAVSQIARLSVNEADRRRDRKETVFVNGNRAERRSERRSSVNFASERVYMSVPAMRAPKYIVPPSTSGNSNWLIRSSVARVNSVVEQWCPLLGSWHREIARGLRGPASYYAPPPPQA